MININFSDVNQQLSNTQKASEDIQRVYEDKWREIDVSTQQLNQVYNQAINARLQATRDMMNAYQNYANALQKENQFMTEMFANVTDKYISNLTQIERDRINAKISAYNAKTNRINVLANIANQKASLDLKVYQVTKQYELEQKQKEIETLKQLANIQKEKSKLLQIKANALAKGVTITPDGLVQYTPMEFENRVLKNEKLKSEIYKNYQQTNKLNVPVTKKQKLESAYLATKDAISYLAKNKNLEPTKVFEQTYKNHGLDFNLKTLIENKDAFLNSCGSSGIKDCQKLYNNFIAKKILTFDKNNLPTINQEEVTKYLNTNGTSLNELLKTINSLSIDEKMKTKLKIDVVTKSKFANVGQLNEAVKTIKSFLDNNTISTDSVIALLGSMLKNNETLINTTESDFPKLLEDIFKHRNFKKEGLIFDSKFSFSDDSIIDKLYERVTDAGVIGSKINKLLNIVADGPIITKEEFKNRFSKSAFYKNLLAYSYMYSKKYKIKPTEALNATLNYGIYSNENFLSSQYKNVINDTNYLIKDFDKAKEKQIELFTYLEPTEIKKQFNLIKDSFESSSSLKEFKTKLVNSGIEPTKADSITKTLLDLMNQADDKELKAKYDNNEIAQYKKKMILDFLNYYSSISDKQEEELKNIIIGYNIASGVIKRSIKGE